MQTTNQATQVEAKAAETVVAPAKVELSALQLTLVGGGIQGNALFG